MRPCRSLQHLLALVLVLAVWVGLGASLLSHNSCLSCKLPSKTSSNTSSPQSWGHWQTPALRPCTLDETSHERRQKDEVQTEKERDALLALLQQCVT